MKLTIEFLNTNNACKDGISFAVNNKLLGFPLDKLNDVKGDHADFVSWLRKKLIEVKEYDANNNLIHYRNSDGYESWNEIEYYDDGQLKRFNKLELPWFEK